MAYSGWTNKGRELALDVLFRGQNTPASFSVMLVTDAVVPDHETETGSELDEITTGNGYTAGGITVTRNTTNFDVITENDTDDYASVQMIDMSWDANGGSIPASGDGASYAILVDDSDNAWHFWYLDGVKTATAGNEILLQDLATTGFSVGGDNSFTNRGIYILLRAIFQATSVPASFSVALATDEIAVTPDTDSPRTFAEIPGGNGYTTGGAEVPRSTVGFPTLTNTGSAMFVSLTTKVLEYVASGGAIPLSGQPCAYAILLDDGKNAIAYWTLASRRGVADGQTFSLTLTLGLSIPADEQELIP